MLSRSLSQKAPGRTRGMALTTGLSIWINTAHRRYRSFKGPDHISTLIFSGGRASSYPPLAPRMPLTSPAFRNVPINCSR